MAEPPKIARLIRLSLYMFSMKLNMTTAMAAPMMKVM